MDEEDEDWLASDQENDAQERRGQTEMEQRDRLKMQKDFYNVRLDEGKMEAIQAGFDQGYNETGVPIGSVLGELRGEADAVAFLLAERSYGKELGGTQHDAREKLAALRATLAHATLDDLAEPDWDIVEHELAHHSAEDAPTALAKMQQAYNARPDLLSQYKIELAELIVTLLPQL
ncbi:hypothetical protein MVES_003794 [Malassezia vespertilionis]|uniref:Protein yae1 n=1 Tax=Malassezia vespertilionis TaxID=2020962 RepID=A0A2N1J6V3_9BASI|nr:hypothetical protein MVES_003794 [Malassezia vespertilionis]